MSEYMVPPNPRNAARMVSMPPVPSFRSAHCPIEDEHHETHGELDAEPGVPHRPGGLAAARLRGIHGAKLPACEKFRKPRGDGPVPSWSNGRDGGSRRELTGHRLMRDELTAHPQHADPNAAAWIRLSLRSTARSDDPPRVRTCRNLTSLHRHHDRHAAAPHDDVQQLERLVGAVTRLAPRWRSGSWARKTSWTASSPPSSPAATRCWSACPVWPRR